jgi:uncharacterized zinc-type alcohol dehydrogenase-like protein
LGPKDVAIRLRYCGVCHSDIHTVRGDWGQIQYPLIVGHELAGEVVAVGFGVSRFRVGSRVGVGTMVNSCRHWSECEAGYGMDAVQAGARAARNGLAHRARCRVNVQLDDFI